MKLKNISLIPGISALLFFPFPVEAAIIKQENKIKLDGFHAQQSYHQREQDYIGYRRYEESQRQQAEYDRQQAAIKKQKQVQQWRDSIPELESKRDYMALAVIFKNLRENKKLSDAAEKAVKANPNSALAYNLRAIARKRSNDLQGALADYNRAVEISPNEYLYYTNRGDLKKGFDKNGAIQDFLTALKLVKVDRYAFRSETERVIRELQSLGLKNSEWDSFLSGY